MNTEFIPYEQALELKELGFNEPCFGLYAPPSKTIFLHHFGLLSAKEQILGPLYQQAFRWFRENHNLNCYIDRGGVKGIYNAFVGGSEHGFLYGNNSNSPSEFTYEEAELACLNKLIEIVKNKPV
jgi:hypothetical protein